MARSNAPQALSVVAVTHEADPELTAAEIMAFDNRAFAFSHDRTWAALPMALTGTFDGATVLSQFKNVHPRVARSISALCDLGRRIPRDTRKFRDYPSAGLKEVEPLKYGPNVTIMARASCWYVDDGKPVIPLLQPRSDPLSRRKLAIYTALGRRAYCRGPWAGARIEIVDLSQPGRDGSVVAQVIEEKHLELCSEEDLNSFLKCYVEAQEIAAKRRSEKPAKVPSPSETPLLELLEKRPE